MKCKELLGSFLRCEKCQHDESLVCEYVCGMCAVENHYECITYYKIGQCGKYAV